MKLWPVGAALLVFGLGYACGRGGRAPAGPVPVVARFDSLAVVAIADSVARAEERAALRDSLAALVRRTAAVQRTTAHADSDNARHDVLRHQGLATAGSCGDSVRVLLTADSLCQARGDSLAAANGRLLQINREGQLVADRAIGQQIIAEGKLSQFRVTAKDAIGALGTRVDALQRDQVKRQTQLGFGGDAIAVLGRTPCWTAVAGPEILTRRRLWFLEAEARGTAGVGAGGCGKSVTTGPAASAHLSLTF